MYIFHHLMADNHLVNIYETFMVIHVHLRSAAGKRNRNGFNIISVRSALSNVYIGLCSQEGNLWHNDRLFVLPWMPVPPHSLLSSQCPRIRMQHYAANLSKSARRPSWLPLLWQRSLLQQYALEKLSLPCSSETDRKPKGHPVWKVPVIAKSKMPLLP